MNSLEQKPVQLSFFVVVFQTTPSTLFWDHVQACPLLTDFPSEMQTWPLGSWMASASLIRNTVGIAGIFEPVALTAVCTVIVCKTVSGHLD